jgi:hypothetical protein
VWNHVGIEEAKVVVAEVDHMFMYVLTWFQLEFAYLKDLLECLGSSVG